MRKNLTAFVTVISIALTACNAPKTEKVVSKSGEIKNDSLAQINHLKSVAVKSSEIIDKFKDTDFRRDKLSKGILNYDDTTFNNQMFVITDTIADIRVDNSGKGYILFGREEEMGTNKQDVKCYFTDEKDIAPLRVNQIITVYSKKHYAVVRSFKIERAFQIIAVTMGHCNLIK